MGLDTAVPSGPWRYSDYAVRYTLRHSRVGDGEAHVCVRRANGTLLIVAEKVALVRDYPILQQEGAILLFEGDLPMVLFLSQYVADNHVLVAQAVAEPGILMTPTAKIRKSSVGFQPFAAVGLKSLDERGEGQCRR